MTPFDVKTIALSIPLPGGGALYLCGQLLPAARCDVLYVHGATFPSDLSVFYRLDGRSWADALNEAGFSAWGFDFVGYGRSSRHGTIGDAPLGRAHEALPQLLSAIEHVRSHSAARSVALLAHSWGTAVAARAAIAAPQEVNALVMFGPILCRRPATPPSDLPARRTITVWEQYRAFVEDVPRGEPPVLLDRHFDAWSRAYLRTDPAAYQREPPAVLTPTGPQADIIDLWRGKSLFDPGGITQPLLVVRGEWDSLCPDADVADLLSAVSSPIREERKIPRATHRMHLEERRSDLYRAVSGFLLSTVASHDDRRKR
jgi:pimeloyl-ACP methyl ester carboxylesterase